MDAKEEYHDPDYPGASAPVEEEAQVLSEEEKTEKIKTVIHREFSNELEMRENEVMLIEQRMSTSRRMLHRLRYALVNAYYNEQKLLITKSQIDDDVAAQHDPRARAEVSTLLRDGQRRLHPSVRKLLGKQAVDLADIFKIREPRNKIRKDYSAMVQTRNYTIAADGSKSLRPDKDDETPSPSGASGPSGPSLLKKTPRHLDPKVGKVVTLDEATRNKCKHRYRLIIGNTSKYAPPASRADRSTHKWLLYVRGPPSKPDPSPVLERVVARLHHSYAPAHTVHVYKPPFRVSRRGWGEFPARVELHFPLPSINRPAALTHTIKLDRHYTGLQTLGAETIVDVWLYSTPEMLEFEYFDPVPNPIGIPDTEHQPQEEPDTPPKPMQVEPKTEPVEYDSQDQSENWMEFFSKGTTELDVDEMIIKPVKKEIVAETHMETEIMENDDCNDKEETINEWDIKNEAFEATDTKPTSTLKRIMKYIDSTTGKIYYLEMDRNLDLSKVQEIVINNTKAKISPIKTNGLKNFRKRKGGVSLLRPEVKNQLKSENKDQHVKKIFTHIENDHCYLGSTWMQQPISAEDVNISEVTKAKRDKSHYDSLCAVLCNFTCVKMAVNYMLKKIPIITDRAKDPDYVRNFPFVVENDERYWKLDFAKRRNIEWSRAKLINKMLTEHLNSNSAIWRTKQILVYSRLHGFHPIRPETAHKAPETDEWSSWNDLEHSRRIEANIKEIYPNAEDICSLTVFDSEEIMNSTMESLELTESDEEVDVVSSNLPSKEKNEAVQDMESSLTVLPVKNEEDRLRFMFIEKKCADIGVELRNEDVGNGYSYSAVHAVLLSAMKSFAEELIRSSVAAQLSSGEEPPSVWTGWSGRGRVGVGGARVAAAARGRALLSRRALGTRAARGREAL